MNGLPKIRFDKKEHHFYVNQKSESNKITLELPLSVSLQITRKCNLNCVYCSEADSIPDAPIAEIKEMIASFQGVKRIIVTGGEPLIRKDWIEVLEYLKEMRFENIALATNGTLINPYVAENIADLVDYVDVTIDGSKKIHNTIRGEYDAVINGIKLLSNVGVTFSVVTVLFNMNADSVLYICQLADALGAAQLKIVTPIDKGRGKEVYSELLNSDQLFETFQRIRLEKERNGWMVRIALTDWNRVGEGHAILVHPNGDVVASPVPSQERCVLLLGNVLKENIRSIWRKYPYKENHLSKYLEKTLYVC